MDPGHKAQDDSGGGGGDSTNRGSLSGRPIASYIGVAVVFAILMALGTWQMQRRAWKEDLLATIATGANQPAVTTVDLKALGCDPTLGLLDPCEFRPIRIEGRISGPAEAHVFIAIPRQSNGLQGPGYWVFAPFRPTGSDLEIWINRGFIPEGQKQATDQRIVTGLMTITGSLRQAEPRGQFSATNDLNKHVFFVRAPREFDRCAAPTKDCITPRILDYYIDLTGPVPAFGLPYPMAGRLTIPNRHLEYALTWFGLAATWIIIALAAMRRRT